MSQQIADVLIVEDDGPTQSFLQAICKRLRYTSFSVSDGESAKKHLDGDSEWSVILLDLYLPKCDGFGVIDYVKNTAPGLLDRTIVMTAGGDADVRRVREMGLVHSVLRKPMDIDDLGERMKACSATKAKRKKK